MKKVNSILAVVILSMAGCGGGKQSSDDLIIVDVTKSYSSKKELILQDFMDVEYVVLETNDYFLNQGFVMDIGKENILVKNRTQDGDIFIYDRSGKALRKINCRGQKISEEYTNIYNITLDENNGEMFVNDIDVRKIYVYDLNGKFKRSFDHKESANYRYYTTIFDYDNNNLICYDGDTEEAGFNIISKKDGSITQEIKIPFEKKKYLRQMQQSSGNDNVNIDMNIPPGFKYGGRLVSPQGANKSIIAYYNNWILVEFSSDTIYQFLLDRSLCPFIIRTPSIQSMDKEIMLVFTFFSDRYFFFETIRNEYNFNTNQGFQSFFFMYDKQEKDFSGYNVYNGDYSIKKEIFMNRLRLVNREIESWQPLEAYQLVEDYKKGELKDGRLKEIASKLDVEDNPVIMLIKHK